MNLTNTSAFATPNAWAPPTSSPRSVHAATATTALAESFNGLYKTELIHRKGPWRNVEHVEWATLNYVDWFNNRRIHESLDYVPPVEFEAAYYDSSESESLPVLETI